jgi:DNA-binding PadR family transcriptional regulator
MRHPHNIDRGRPFRPETSDDTFGGGRRRQRRAGSGRGFGSGGYDDEGDRRGGSHRGPHGGRRGSRGWGGPRPRGDVRAAILLLLDEQPRHGYDLISEIADRSEGSWTPSPGSIYPTLRALADEGLIRLERVEGRRTASLTDEGSTWVAEHREELGDPFEVDGPPAAAALLHEEMAALRDAARQVARVAPAAQLTKAAAAVSTARKELYRILAEDDATE